MIRLRQILGDARTAIGLAILVTFALCAVGAPILAPADPIALPDVLGSRFIPPLARDAAGTLHVLGTDALGRDLFSRLLFGARISLSVGLLSVTVAVALGTTIGVVAALAGGLVERALMGLTDAALALPRLVLLLALASVWQQSLLLVVLVLGLTGWMTIARLVRAEVNGILRRPYVEASRAGGAGRLRMMRDHLLPNAWTPVIVTGALGVGNAIMLEAGLSFLGLGIPAPTPSWGNLIANGRDALVSAPWISTFPGLAVALSVVACNLFGDGLRDALDPTTRH